MDEADQVITNYDGSLTCHPRRVVFPDTVAAIQAVLRDTSSFPGPVRAKGSYHSLTPCVATDGTILEMSRMSQVLRIDAAAGTLTAQAGMQMIDANHAMREDGLQFMTNVEIGNMTLGSAATCHSKDALDGIEFGQAGSYVTAMKWVTPAGELAQASETDNPALMRRMRASHGLAGVVYQVTFRVKPIEALRFTYTPRPVAELTAAEVDALFDGAEGVLGWTLGDTTVFQRRERIDDAGALGGLQAATRRDLWAHTEARVARFIDHFLSNPGLREAVHRGFFGVDHLLFSFLHERGGITLLAPDKTVDYRQSPPEDRYAFTFWAFPRARWLDLLREYLAFADAYFRETGFRCNMPLGSYFIRRDTKSLLSYSHDGDIVSIDPIHASTDDPAWHSFLRRFNQFASERGGTPLLNQSPFIERHHLEAAYGERWREFSAWVREQDPAGRMRNDFFAELLSP